MTVAEPAANNYPAAPPSPPTYGLSLAIEPIKSGRWQGGIKYVPEGCTQGTTLSLYKVQEKTPSNRPAEVVWIPYILSYYERCSTLSDDFDEAAGRARRGLLVDTERQLAEEFWSGVISQSEQWQGAVTPNTWLTNAPLTLTGTPTDAVQALICLDAYLGHETTGEIGAIHAPIEVFDVWAAEDVIEKGPDGNWYTPIGNLVITSPGYSGDAPDDSGYPVGLWAYATDIPRVFLTDVRVPGEALQATDRLNNDMAVLAERIALAEWKRCRHAGIPIDVDTCNLI